MTGPHEGRSVLRAGAPLEEARAAAILVHGRGGAATDMLGLAAELGVGDLAFLAPRATGGTWYPYSFLAPLSANEPGLSSALAVLDEVVGGLAASGIAPERVALVGFSQGACLALEFVARRGRPYGGVAGLSGGLIGPPGTPRDYPGSLEGTPVFLGCSDVDPHIPLARVEETAAVLGRLGARVTTRIYPGMGHTVNDDELAHLRALLADLVAAPADAPPPTPP